MSVEDPARGRRGTFDLNLVPFIDLLSVCITFLVATAVWIEVSAMPLDQAIGEEETVTPTEPPLRVHLTASGVRVGRREQELLPLVGGEPDWAGVSRQLAADRQAFPDEAGLVIVTDDGQPYGDMIRTLDLAAEHGFARPVLGGGPPDP